MGIQASGKSTFCRLFFPALPLVSMDVLKKRKREEKRIEALIASGSSFIVDNSNPTAEDRQRYIPAAKAAGYRIIGLFFPLDVQASLDRNGEKKEKTLLSYQVCDVLESEIELLRLLRRQIIPENVLRTLENADSLE